MRTSVKQASAVLAALFMAGGIARGAEDAGWVTYSAKPGPGNLVSIEGTSTIHDWRVEGPIIAGQFLAGPGFPLKPDDAKPGKVEAKTKNIFIPVRSLKSVKDGKPYSNAMDEVMQEHLRMADHKMIRYELKELTLKEAPQGADTPFLFEAKGDLMVAGETQTVTMPLKMEVDGKILKFMGEIETKMTDFKVDPPAPKLALGAIKTGDEIKLGISWVVQTR